MQLARTMAQGLFVVVLIGFPPWGHLPPTYLVHEREEGTSEEERDTILSTTEKKKKICPFVNRTRLSVLTIEYLLKRYLMIAKIFCIFIRNISIFHGTVSRLVSVSFEALFGYL